MKVADAIQQMSKLPLQRIVDSFTKDFPKPDENQARDIILRNVRGTDRPGTDSDRSAVRRALLGADPADVHAGGVREPFPTGRLRSRTL